MSDIPPDQALDQAALATAREEEKRRAAESGPPSDVVDGALDLADVAGAVFDLGSQVLGACLEGAKAGAAGSEVVASGALEVAKVVGEGAVSVAGEVLSSLGDLG
ncbi:hypothetical protein [Falsiroseomonas sp. HW251]|uniref:hypothetical protein n=1 Tax=Falsiroseomonas sp. HW251 TaxID=3390998 RepID=UPI003D321CB4